jgi:hypothetical protein
LRNRAFPPCSARLRPPAPGLLVEIGDQDVGAGLGETAGRAEPEALGAAGDDGHAPLERDQAAKRMRVEVRAAIVSSYRAKLNTLGLK